MVTCCRTSKPRTEASRTERHDASPHVLLALLLFSSQAGVQAQDDVSNVAAVAPQRTAEDAIVDYVRGIYEAKPERIRRSVHPQLHKFGYAKRDGEWKKRPMTFEQLVELAGTYNKDGTRIPKDAPQKIEKLFELEHIAGFKLTAAWGVDYMQVGRDGNTWKIRHVLWQSHPPEGFEVAKEDHMAIAAAAFNYIDAFYTVKPELLEGSVSKDLVKFGYYRADRRRPRSRTR